MQIARIFSLFFLIIYGSNHESKCCITRGDGRGNGVYRGENRYFRDSRKRALRIKQKEWKYFNGLNWNHTPASFTGVFAVNLRSAFCYRAGFRCRVIWVWKRPIDGDVLNGQRRKKGPISVHRNPKDQNITGSSIFCWLTHWQVHLWLYLEQSLRALLWYRAASQASLYLKLTLKNIQILKDAALSSRCVLKGKPLLQLKALSTVETEWFRSKLLVFPSRGRTR